jgi:cyclohexanone monooxygenase
MDKTLKADAATPSADLDVTALQEKYRAERARRLRTDGAEQYIDIEQRFANFRTDPYNPPIVRDAVDEDVEVVIVGGGWGGLLTGARLREAGISNFRIIESGGDFGGTWYWNRYPGAACDTESYIYMPLLEETGYIPKRKYARAPEILEHSQRIGRQYGLYEHALFQTRLRDGSWSEADARWNITTDRGDVIRTRFLVLACGPLQRPKLPGIPGIETYKGHTFHTSRWDYAYTGGDADGNLANLADKRVGIIGTGATAVQCIPHLGRSAKELYVFQRTPSSVDVRNDQMTSEEWAASLPAGWQRDRMDNFTRVVSGEDFDEDLVNDGWTDINYNVKLAAHNRAKAGEQIDDPEALIQLADYLKMGRVRARVDEIVKDPATAAALKPWYNQFCKRPCFHDEYLPTFNRPNVHLVDTGGKGVERLTEGGVVVDGKEYPVDCLIFATGFEVGTAYTRQVGIELTGRDGLKLSEKWASGAETLHSLFTRGFPNLCIVSTRQVGQSPNFQHIINEQTRHLTYVLGRARELGVRTLEATAEAEQAWTAEVVESAEGLGDFLEQCTPGYYNNEGAAPTLQGKKSGLYFKGPIAFIGVLEAWREEGNMAGLELTFDADTAPGREKAKV